MSNIHPSAIVHEGVELSNQVTVEEFSVLGKDRQDRSSVTTALHNECRIGAHATVYAGSTIKSNAVIGDYAKVGYDSTIGTESRIVYRSQVYSNVDIAENCIIGGFLCNDSSVGNGSRIFGAVIHQHDEPQLRWGSVDEPSPEIQADVFAGFNSKIIGDITIESQSYICSGAIVTRDVPQKSVVYGVNEIVPYDEFTGELSQSEFFS